MVIPSFVTDNPLRVIAVALAMSMATASAQAQAPAKAPPNGWAKLPRMQLERQFAGPLQDTVIQRWRDPVDGTICYIYLPITAAHSPPTANGYVQYGANSIGSVSCMPGPRRPEHSAAHKPHEKP